MKGAPQKCGAYYMKRFFKYYAVFHPDKKGYWLEFPDVSGAFSEGDTFDDAYSMAQDCLALLLISMQEKGRDVPKPSTEEEIKRVAEDGDQVVLVSVDCKELYPEYDYDEL